MLRHALYEAANSMLSRLKRPCALQIWGKKLAEAKGPKRARIAVARKLAALLHKLWQSEADFAGTDASSRKNRTPEPDDLVYCVASPNNKGTASGT